MANKVLTDSLSVPINGATTARFDINVGDGNLTIDKLTSGEGVLASGALEYLEKEGVPERSVSESNGQATLMLRGGADSRPRFRLPWEACNGATEWHIHISPSVLSDITAHSDGGNVRLDLAGIAMTRVTADTGGGNIEVLLPDDAANLEVAARTGAGNVTVDLGRDTTGNNSVNAKSGAGNVTVRVPIRIAARIHATTGLGKAIVDPRFSKIEERTYQSPDYDAAANKVDITLTSGAGNVCVSAE